MNRLLYFLAVMPDDPLKGILEEVQQEFARNFSCKAALKTPIHVTLVPPFYSDVESMTRASLEISQLLRSFEPFPIRLNDFGFFPKNKVVYVNVQLSPQLRSLQSRLEELMVVHFGDGVKRYPSYHPHLTIGRKDIPPRLYPKAELEYSTRSFSAIWHCDRVIILKHDGARWRRDRELLLGLPF
jgi:2'-5' RNA ligase